MTKSLTLLDLSFDLENEVIHLLKPMNAQELYSCLKDYFLKIPDLFAIEFPMTVLETTQEVYYVSTWEIAGPVELVMQNRKKQRLIIVEGP